MRMKLKDINRKGFTLIELLVVVAIISMLASIVFASLNTARIQARNAQRLLAAKQVQTALELYYTDHGNYPAASDQPLSFLQSYLVPAYIPSIPTDPKPGPNYGGYRYHTGGATDWYAIFLDKEPDQGTVYPTSSCYLCNGPGTSACGTNPQMWSAKRCY